MPKPTHIRIPHDRWLEWFFRQAAADLGDKSSFEALIAIATGGVGTRDPEARMTDRRVKAAAVHRHIRKCLYERVTAESRKVLIACYGGREPKDDEKHIARVFGQAYSLAIVSEAADRDWSIAQRMWEKPPKTVEVFLARACVANLDAELAGTVQEVDGAIKAALMDWFNARPHEAEEILNPKGEKEVGLHACAKHGCGRIHALGACPPKTKRWRGEETD